MKRNLLLVLSSLALLSIPLVGQEKVVIAVFDLQPTAGVTATESQAISENLRNELFNTGVFTLVERKNIYNVFQQRGIAEAGLGDAATANELGRLLTAQRVIIGTIGSLFGQTSINIRVVTTETGEIVLSEDINATSTEISDKIIYLAKQIANSVSDLVAYIDEDTIKELIEVKNFEKAKKYYDLYLERNKDADTDILKLGDKINSKLGDSLYESAWDSYKSKEKLRLKNDPSAKLERVYVTLGINQIDLGNTSGNKTLIENARPEDLADPNVFPDAPIVLVSGSFGTLEDSIGGNYYAFQAGADGGALTYFRVMGFAIGMGPTIGLNYLSTVPLADAKREVPLSSTSMSFKFHITSSLFFSDRTGFYFKLTPWGGVVGSTYKPQFTFQIMANPLQVNIPMNCRL